MNVNMGIDFNLEIRKSISRAQNDELRSQALQSYAEDCLPKLHRAIQLPEPAQADALANFIRRYIEHVPDFLDALTEIAKSAGIYDFIAKIVHIAQSFFLSPPELLREHRGLQALIDESYLAHRLMEEINDRIMLSCGIPLIPMDMTRSNIIIHCLLGEDFANELDLAVHYAIEQLFANQACINDPTFRAYITLYKAEGWTDLFTSWSCLAGDSSIAIELLRPPMPKSLH